MKKLLHFWKSVGVLILFFLSQLAVQAEDVKLNKSNGSNLISASLDEADRLDTTAFEQAVPVAGTITDMDGAPLPGVTVMIKGTTTGTTTDIDGNFSIDVPDENAVLVFSYVGFVTEEVAVGSQSQISI